MLADLPWPAVVTPCLIAGEARWVTAQYGQEETIELFFFVFLLPFPVLRTTSRDHLALP